MRLIINPTVGRTEIITHLHNIKGRTIKFFDACWNDCVVIMLSEKPGEIGTGFLPYSSQKQQSHISTITLSSFDSQFEKKLALLRERQVVEETSKLFLINFVSLEFLYDFTVQRPITFLSRFPCQDAEIPVGYCEEDTTIYRFVDGTNLASVCAAKHEIKHLITPPDKVLESVGIEFAMTAFIDESGLDQPKNRVGVDWTDFLSPETELYLGYDIENFQSLVEVFSDIKITAE